jgi:hypothetical protein
VKALARKECIELFVPFVPILVVVCLVWFGNFRLEDALLAPRDGAMSAVLCTAAGAGLLAALVQFDGERFRGTWGFLIHRGGGHGGCFRTKAWTGTATGVLLGILPPLVFAIVHATVLGNSRVVQWARVVEFGAIGSVGVSAYAIATLALGLRRGFWSELILALTGIGGWLVVSVGGILLAATRLEMSANRSGMLVAFVAVQIGAALSFLRLAGRVFEASRDRDLPLGRSHHAVLIGLAVVLWIPIPLLVLGGIQSEIAGSFLQHAPLVVQERSSGELLMVAPVDDDLCARLEEGRLVPDARLVNFQRNRLMDGELDIVHDPRRGSVDRKAYRAFAKGPAAQAFGNWGWGWPSYAGGRGFDSRVGRMNAMAWLDRDAGVLRQFALRLSGYGDATESLDPSKSPPELPFERIVEKPSGNRRFSSSSVLIDATVRMRLGHDDVKRAAGLTAVHTNAGAKCIADPEDHTLWSFDVLDFTNPLRPIELPDADRLLDAGSTPLYDRSMLRVGQFNATFQIIIRGEKGIYEWTGTEFRAIAVDSQDRYTVPDELADTFVEIQAVPVDPDPLAPTIEVRDARSGAVLLTHRYSPTENGGGILAGLLHVGAMLRPPALNVVSYLHDTRGAVPSLRGGALLYEGLLANRSRTWLLALSFLVSIGLAGLAVRRAHERGSGRNVVILSTLLVGAFGFVGFLAVDFLEARGTKRREAKPETRAEPVVLIESVRAT